MSREAESRAFCPAFSTPKKRSMKIQTALLCCAVALGLSVHVRRRNVGTETRHSRRPRVWPLVHAFLAAGLFSGCGFTPWRVTPFRAPGDVAHIRLEHRDSPRIAVDKIWLERKEGSLAVTGYVQRARLDVEDTMGSHLVVSLLDANGAELRSTPIDFGPRQIPRHRRPPAVSTYRCVLDPLPPDTATIVVTARDDRPTS